MDNLKSLIYSYERWVATNAETVADLEQTTKWISYLIAGRISDSHISTELIYSLSNIIQLYNDRIIESSRKPTKGITYIPATTVETSLEESKNTFCYRLKIVLTTLEYCEVLIELSARRLFGNKGRWLFIIMLQCAKAAGRFFILKHSTEKIITSPSLPNINRRALLKESKLNGISNVKHYNQPTLDDHCMTFELKRSGRLVRKVEGAPPFHYRDFNLNNIGNSIGNDKNTIPNILLRAEYLYIAKPLLHLASIGLFGEHKWKQYLVSISLDLLSIRLYHKHRDIMTKEQKLEMSRRCMNLIMYLVRSPFYDAYTKRRVEAILDFVTNHIPIIRLVAGPLKAYIPHWQNTYFYMWST